jgi:hypothetical protein
VEQVTNLLHNGPALYAITILLSLYVRKNVANLSTREYNADV